MQKPLVRNIAATLAGLIVAAVVVGVCEGAGHAIFPPPAGIDLANAEDLRRLMEVIPLGAKLAVVLAWFLGALVGSATAIYIAKASCPGWIVGLVMVGLSIFTTQMFPHPVWMVLAALVLPLVAVLAARKLLRGRITPSSPDMH